MLLGAGIYATLYTNISNLEFWGDEVITIRNVFHPNPTIKGKELELALGIPSIIAEPPLNGLILRNWIFKVNKYVNKELYEFWYRIPYMIFHTIAAIVFATLLSRRQKGFAHSFLSRSIYYLVFFSIYFFNPILFRYSLELRPYILSALGSVVILSLYFERQLHKYCFIPLYILFLLNSFSFIIYVIPFFFIYALENSKHRKPTLLIFLVLGVCTLFLTRLVYFGNAYVFTGFKEGMSNLLAAQFTFVQLFVAICMALASWTFLFKDISRVMFGIAVSFFLICASLLMAKNTFYPRYLVFLIPSALYTLASVGLLKRDIVRRIGSVVLALTIIIPWTYAVIYSFDKITNFYRDSMGAKRIAVFARNTGKNIIVINDIPEVHGYGFYLNNTFDWYMNLYAINYLRLENSEVACKAYDADKKSIYVSILQGPLCPHTSSYIDKIQESLIQSHQKLGL